MARSIRVVGDNNTKEIYQIFKDFVDANYKKNHVEFVEDIVSFVPFYKWIIYEEHTDIISEDKNNDSEIKIAFNSKYMMESIKALESEEIELMFNGEIKPIILKNPESDDLIQLILPIRTY